MIGSGEAPGGDDVELVALRVEAKTGQVDTEVRTCISFDSPETARSTGTCLLETELTSVEATVLAAPSALYPESQFVVQGITGSDAEAVEVALTQPDGDVQDLPVVMGTLTQPLAEAIDSDQEAGAFIAFVPPLVDQLIGLEREEAASVIESITVTVYGEDGEVLSQRALDAAGQDSAIPLPDDPKNPRRIDLPPTQIPEGPVPAGSGTTFGRGIEGIPSPFASIGSLSDPERVQECDQAFATGEIRGESLGASDVEYCGIILAQEAGTLEAGEYSRPELAQAIGDANVVPDRYQPPFTRDRRK